MQEYLSIAGYEKTKLRISPLATKPEAEGDLLFIRYPWLLAHWYMIQPAEFEVNLFVQR